MANNDLTTRTGKADAAREIKASAHYAYVTNGITLDGSKFATGELVLEGTCLAMNNTSKKYEKYADVTGAFPATHSNPVILDESLKFTVNDAGVNPDLTAGQVIVHGAVYNGMLIGVTDAFKETMGAAVRFVQG